MAARVLISGSGIAGLTLAVLLKERGWEPLVVEREPAPRPDGYMMDFFGTGWDVAERMGLVDRIRAVDYPIDAMEYVDRQGETWLRVPISRVRNVLSGRYNYLRRPDLERILRERAEAAGVEIRYGGSIESMVDEGTAVNVVFEDGLRDFFSLVFGADGVHSRVRELAFGPESDFAAFLGYYVAAFHIADRDYPVDRAFRLHEETGRVAGFYPLSERTVDATYTFRHDDIGFVPPGERLALVREVFEDAGWISQRVLADYPGSEPIFFDALTQIDMPSWSSGRVALVGDACGCLTLLAGQGAQMAMAGAFVIARELERHRGHHAAAFAAYEQRLKPHVARAQRSARQLSRSFVPSVGSRPWLRRLTMRLVFSRPVVGLMFRMLGARSVLAGYE